MAGPIAGGNRIKVTYACRGGSQNGMNVLLYRVSTGAGGTATPQAFATALGDRAKPLYQDVLPLDFGFYGAKVQKVAPDVEPPAYQVYASNQGAFAAGAAPLQCSAVVTLSTNRAGRKWRGRKYIPFVPLEGLETSTKLTTTYKSAVQALANGLFLPFSASVGGVTFTFTPIISRQGQVDEEPVVITRVRDFCGTQRSRSLLGKNDDIPW